MIHRHLFKDGFTLAGRIRTVRIAKGSSMFCYPEHNDSEMRNLFDELEAEDFLRGRTAEEFARLSAHVLTELNAIHPFREGNGRAQWSYLALLAERAAHPLAMTRMDPTGMLAAMVKSFKSDEVSLAALIAGLIER